MSNKKLVKKHFKRYKNILENKIKLKPRQNDIRKLRLIKIKATDIYLKKKIKISVYFAIFLTFVCIIFREIIYENYYIKEDVISSVQEDKVEEEILCNIVEPNPNPIEDPSSINWVKIGIWVGIGIGVLLIGYYLVSQGILSFTPAAPSSAPQEIAEEAMTRTVAAERVQEEMTRIEGLRKNIDKIKIEERSSLGGTNETIRHRINIKDIIEQRAAERVVSNNEAVAAAAAENARLAAAGSGKDPAIEPVLIPKVGKRQLYELSENEVFIKEMKSKKKD